MWGSINAVRGTNRIEVSTKSSPIGRHMIHTAVVGSRTDWLTHNASPDKVWMVNTVTSFCCWTSYPPSLSLSLKTKTLVQIRKVLSTAYESSTVFMPLCNLTACMCIYVYVCIYITGDLLTKLGTLGHMISCDLDRLPLVSTYTARLANTRRYSLSDNSTAHIASTGDCMRKLNVWSSLLTSAVNKKILKQPI